MSQATMNIVLTSIVAPVLLLIAGSIIRYLESKKKAQDASTANTGMKTKNENVWNAIALAERAVCTAVISVSQTYVDDMKATGTFGPEQQLEALAKAKQAVYDTVKPDAIQMLKDSYQDVDKWIEGQIELYVNRTKVVKPEPVGLKPEPAQPIEKTEVPPVLREVPQLSDDAALTASQPANSDPSTSDPTPAPTPEPVGEAAPQQEQAAPYTAPNNSPIPDSPSV